jgi:hypothetical protein
MENDTPFWQWAVGGALIIGALVGAAYMFGWIDIGLHRTFDPQYEQVRRQTFEQSHAFNDGEVQELDQMEREYKTSKDPDARAAIASEFRHRVSGYNLDDPAVSADLRSFALSIK